MSLPVTPAPKVWFDAADAGTITSDAQGNVTSWVSKGSITPTITATPTGSASRTFYLGSNGGLSVAFRARFNNLTGFADRIFDFGNGTSSNIHITKYNAFNQLMIRVWEGTTLNVDVVSSVNSLDTSFHNWIFRINGNTKTVQIYRDTQLDTTSSYSTDMADRTLSTGYIGRSLYGGDSYTEADISALYVFDRYITDDEMATINTHMANNTAIQLPIYNAKVSLNAALLTQANNTVVSAWEDFSQATAGNRPTFQLNPPRITFSRATAQHLQSSSPVVKTARITQNGRNSIWFPPESSLRTTTLPLAGTTVRSVFAVARNLTDVNGGNITTWSNVRYVRLERTTAVDSNIININEIEVYDAQGRRIPHNTLTATMSSVLSNDTANYGPGLTINNNISTAITGFPHTQDLAGSWIQVDLGQERTVSKVIIRNRYDGATTRIQGTTLRLQRADNATNVASIPINFTSLSYIFTPNGLVYGARNQRTNLFTSTTSVTGAIIARYADYRSLQMIPGGGSTNLDSYMINDTETNIFSLVNDSGVVNSVRVNGYPQTMVTPANNAYTTTTSQYTMNYNAAGEQGSTLQLCELLVYDTTLTIAQIQQIEKYLYDRWYAQAAGAASTTIPVPRVWFDANDADTIQANTQNTLTNWTSKGNAYGIVGSPGAGIGASRRFNPTSNGGFTVAFRARFSLLGNWERIFDFGNSFEANNIVLTRAAGTNQLLLRILEGSTISFDVVSTANAIDTAFHTWIIRVNLIPTTKVGQVYKDSLAAPENTVTLTTSTFTDRTLTTCYIGESHWGADEFFQGDISALYVFDRAVTDEEMAIMKTHMDNNTATQLPIYNPIVSLNAALINATAGTALTAWEDFTASGSPTFQTSPEKTVRFVRSSSQYFVEGNPILKTGRIQQYGKNSIFLPPQSALQTTVALTGSTASRSVFAVARNLTEMSGGTPTPWANVRYVRLQRTTGTDPLNINEIEVYDGTGKRIPVNTLTATQSSTFASESFYGPQFAIDNSISTVFDRGYVHTNAGASEFVQVDLGSERSVSKVIIRNRYDEQEARLVGTTLFLRRADGVTNVASQAITQGLDSILVTPGGVYGAKFTQNNLFANTTVPGAVNADITDYKTLSMNPQGSGNNVDSTLMVDDTQPNVFALVNDATAGNLARVNATTQTLRTTATNAYTNTSATYTTNYNAVAEANSALQLCELLVYDTFLTSQQVTDIQTYLIQKWHYAIGTANPDILTPDGSIPNQLTYWWTLSDRTKMSSITLTLTGSGAGTGSASVNALTTTLPQYTFTGLANTSTYNATIFATGEDGQTSVASSYRSAIPSSVPSIPLNVTFSQPSSSTLRVTWTAPTSDVVSPIQWYMVQSEDETLRYATEGYRRDWTITGIPPGTRKFKIQGINTSGYGVPQLSGTTFTFS